MGFSVPSIRVVGWVFGYRKILPFLPFTIFRKWGMRWVDRIFGHCVKWRQSATFYAKHPILRQNKKPLGLKIVESGICSVLGNAQSIHNFANSETDATIAITIGNYLNIRIKCFCV